MLQGWKPRNSGPFPLKNAHFFAQKWPKNANFGQKNIVFWAPIASTSPLHPILQMPDAKKNLFLIIGASK